MTSRRKTLFLCLFFVSGACGLIYEIVWGRLLVFVFGGTTFAITTVLACFMSGLALGSVLAGRWSAHARRPERLYGALEIAIGVYCLFVPFLFDLATPVYRVLARLSGESFAWLTAARALVSAAILILPTACMGATLPLLTQAFVRRTDELGDPVARLYGFNTLGAFCGCFAAGFFALPLIGLRGSIWIAAFLNVAVGTAALLIARGPEVADGPRPPEASFRREAPGKARKRRTGKKERTVPADPPDRGETLPLLRPGLLLILYGLSGFAAMAYQVAWTRALILSMGSSTYAFSAIVACFIFSLGAGSVLAARWIDRIRNPLALAGWLEAAIGLSALVVVPLFGEMPGLVERIARAPGATFARVLPVEVLCVFGLLIVPTLCMGALMPLICRAFQSAVSEFKPAGEGPRPPNPAGKIVGSVYAANTLGTVLGAVVAGFVLIPCPWIGMRRAIVLASALSGAIATAFVLSGGKRRRGRAFAYAGFARSHAALAALWLAGALAVALSEPWSREVMVSGPYLGREKTQFHALFYREGIDTTVAVTASGGKDLSLRVNGKPDASTQFADMTTQYLLGHIPLLLKPSARDICVIGLGSGCTVGAALGHPIETVDVAEISGEVVEAARYFDRVNNGALKDPRVRIRRADGRNFLLLTDKKYDLIVSEPSNVWVSGIANLFTREFFRLARGRLNPGGLHCQWIHSYSIGQEELAAVIGTFRREFPHTQLWETYFDDLLILGSDSPIAVDVESMFFAFGRPWVAKTLQEIFLNDPMQLAAHYLGGGQELASWTADAPELTDDWPCLEFAAPRRLLGSDAEKIAIRRRLDALEGFPPMTSSNKILNQRFRDEIEEARECRQALARAAQEGESPKGAVERARAALHGTNDPRVALLFLDAPDGFLADLTNLKREDSDSQTSRKADFFAGAVKQLRNVNDGKPYTLYWPLGRKDVFPGDESQMRALLLESKRLSDANKGKVAFEMAKKALQATPDDPKALVAAGLTALGIKDAESALPALLQAWIMRPLDTVPASQLARAYSLRSGGRPPDESRQDRERALFLLERAIENGYRDLDGLEKDPLLEPLRDDPAFRRLITSVP